MIRITLGWCQGGCLDTVNGFNNHFHSYFITKISWHATEFRPNLDLSGADCSDLTWLVFGSENTIQSHGSAIQRTLPADSAPGTGGLCAEPYLLPMRLGSKWLSGHHGCHNWQVCFTIATMPWSKRKLESDWRCVSFSRPVQYPIIASAPFY